VEVEFDLTPADVEALQRYHRESRQSPAGAQELPVWSKWALWYLLALLAMALLTVAAIFPSVAAAAWGILLIAFPLAVVVGCFLSILGWLPTGAAESAAGPPPAPELFGPRRYSITPQGLASESASRQALESWADVIEIVTTVGHSFFYTWAGEVYILPRRAFRDSREFDEFVALARRYKEGMPASTAITTTPSRPTTITRAPE
jgi:hypothetical protein